MEQHGPSIEELRATVQSGTIRWRSHALERLLSRGITRSGVFDAVNTGRIIERYTDDKPFPSVLVAAGDPTSLHVVMALDRTTGLAYVISAYRPDSNHFEDDGITRRSP
ncbi:MAG: DUF4258 domain-containing protein [Spirochaetota bacterium]